MVSLRGAVAMRIFIGINHPAHVHLFRNVIHELIDRGHSIVIGARDKEVTLKLLEAYNLNYELISAMSSTSNSLVEEAVARVRVSRNIFRKYKPDLAISMMEPTIPIASKLSNIPHIALTDTEHAKLANILTHPFTEAVLTPSCFSHSLGKKQIRYNGYPGSDIWLI